MRSLLLVSFALVATLSAQEPAQAQRLMRATPAELQALRAPWDKAGAWSPYWEALAEVQRARLAPPAEAEALLEAAETRLKGRKDADSLALRGTIFSSRIGLHPMSAMTFAPKAQAFYAKAREIEPANPRVRFQEAIHALHTPAFFGGGPKAALPLLKAAVEAAEAETRPADPWAPAWGRAEALAWLAEAYRQDKQIPAAKEAVARCLTLDAGWDFPRSLQAKLP